MKIKNDLEGVEFLRNLVDFLNSRDEYLNEKKSPITLIHEYRIYLKTLKN